ncbi:MAG: DUF1343 domain-containing protein, partial [Gemmatimonadota bacterium]|nr:DUF1343 domain-containing protein [Gemmatimonadota bacterium]
MRTAQWVLGVVVIVLGVRLAPRLVLAPPPTVQPGIDVLLSDSMQLLRGRRVGLVSHQAGVDAAGVPDAQRLLSAGVQLVALFNPEHGYSGTADPGALVASSRDSATGLPIYSLYRRTSASTDSMLAGVDLVLVDLQDAGARYYTYLWTTVEVMRSAARRGIPVVVLDRPNPVGGAVQGNVLDTLVSRTAVGFLAIPMRHGMTLGELALLARHDLHLSVDLSVVPMRGWRRAMYFDETGLPFVPPSPNLRTLEALVHYPGLCLFEGTTLSVGRGSDHPFEQIGGVELDTARLLAELRRSPPPGVRFVGTTFTPHAAGDGKYNDTTLTGIRLEVTDRSSYDPTLTAVRLLGTVAGDRVHFPGFHFLPEPFRRLFGGDTLLPRQDASRAKADPGWLAQLAEFRERRRPFLIYQE